MFLRLKIAIFFLYNVIFIIIERKLPILLSIKLCSPISMLAAEFDTQNTKTKKENARLDVTQIIVAQKVYQIFQICFQYFIHR